VIDIDRAAVIGLGLIGGSIARELASRQVRVHGFDENSQELQGAVRAGAVHHVLDASLADIHGIPLVVIAVPVDAAIDVLARMARHASGAALITDVGSTKTGIVTAATRLDVGRVFVGSHPIAGDHRSGWAASRLGLFSGSRVYLCPASDASPATVDRAVAFWRELGADHRVLTADEHDRHVAWTSHLPHVVANAVALALAGSGVQRHELGPGGRDVTRLAGSSPEMWAAILRENGRAVDGALAAAEREIAGFRDAIGRGDADALRRRFADARDWSAA
jgi:3-phosphoshikimate 1-carboxyvinyltransferase